MGNCCVHVRNCAQNVNDISNNDLNYITLDKLKASVKSKSSLVRRSATMNFTPIKIRTIHIDKNPKLNGEKCLQKIHNEITRNSPSSLNVLNFIRISTRNSFLRKASYNRAAKISSHYDSTIFHHLQNSRFNVDVVDNNNTDQLNAPVTNNIPSGVIKHNDTDNNELTLYEMEKIHQVLLDIFLFEGFTEDIIKLIMSELVRMKLPHGKFIYERGFEGNFFFIVGEGKVNIIHNKKVLRSYAQWECFGHMSLLCDHGPSKAKNSAQCEGNVMIYVLDGENFQNIRRELIKVRLEEQFNFIKQIPIFASLDAVAKYNIAEKITLNEYDEGDKIIDSKIKITDDNNTNNNTNSSSSQPAMNKPCYNSNHNILFLIKDGCVEVRRQHRKIRELGVNEYFGVEKILFDELFKSSVNIIAICPTTCYQISKGDLVEALGVNYKEIILLSLFKCFIQNHRYFNNVFSEKNIEHIFKGFSLEFYHNKEDIYSSTKSNKRIIVIIEGNIVHAQNKNAVASRGNIIGEDIIKDNTELSQHIQAFPNLISLECEVTKLFKILHLDEEVNKHLREMKRVNQLKKISLLKFLSEHILTQLQAEITKTKYKPNDVIVKEGTNGGEFFLIKKGRVTIEKNGVFIREIEKGNCFGEMALFSDANNTNNEDSCIRTATVKAVDNVTCFVLNRQSFNTILNNQHVRNFINNKIAMQNTEITLANLYHVKALGKGRFGNVILTRYKKNYYALKAVSIKQISKDRMTKYLLSEKNVLLQLDHPFVMKLVRTLKDESNCYFLMEYVSGQTLSEYLNNRCLFQQFDELRFYAASLLLVVNYIQTKNVVHRDIKPSNIMIDRHGYIKLIDFGTAKILDDYTSTVIGTPQYTAPEVMKGKGYSMSCDYWTIGVIAYEIFYGKIPFGNNSGNDVVAIYNSVLHEQPQFSTNINYKAIDDFIRMLLEKKVNKRICNFNVLRKAKIFDIDRESDLRSSTGTYMNKDYFDMVINLEIKPPYIPISKDWKVSSLKDNCENVVSYFKKIQYDDISTVHSSINKESAEGRQDAKWVEQF